MLINTEELCKLVSEVAADKFKSTTFQRRSLMLAVKTVVKEMGWWTDDDDVISTSAGRKSVGLARIDWAISHLKQRGRLLNPSRNCWRVL